MLGLARGLDVWGLEYGGNPDHLGLGCEFSVIGKFGFEQDEYYAILIK